MWSDKELCLTVWCPAACYSNAVDVIGGGAHISASAWLGDVSCSSRTSASRLPTCCHKVSALKRENTSRGNNLWRLSWLQGGKSCSSSFWKIPTSNCLMTSTTSHQCSSVFCPAFLQLQPYLKPLASASLQGQSDWLLIIKSQCNMSVWASPREVSTTRPLGSRC